MAAIYSDLKFVRFDDRLEAIRNRRLMAPVHVRIKPINLCNHGCWYCAYRNDALQLGDAMQEHEIFPESRMMALADDLIDMKVKAVTFSGGGEPLLYKPLPKIMERLAAGGVRLAALTNGSNLQNAMADAFAAHGTWIRVSLDAWDDESYCASRCLRGRPFSRLLENVQRFTARRSPCRLGVSFIVSRDNHGHVLDICRRFKGIGVDHVKLSGVVVANDHVGNDDYHRPIRAAVAEQIAEARQELADERFAVVDHYHAQDKSFLKTYTICPFMQFLTVIGADQTVYSCQDKAYTDDGRLGSFAGGSFKDFWFSEETNRRVWSLNPSHQCRHHCIANAKNEAITEYLSIDAEHGLFV